MNLMADWLATSEMAAASAMKKLGAGLQGAENQLYIVGKLSRIRSGQWKCAMALSLWGNNCKIAAMAAEMASASAKASALQADVDEMVRPLNKGECRLGRDVCRQSVLQ